MKQQEQAKVQRNVRLQGDYRQVDLLAPGISAVVAPGQFVHARFPDLRDRVLRRPFSVCDVDTDGTLRIVYKIVGAGTKHLATLGAGAVVDLLGPLGRGFSLPPADVQPVLVMGGYGCAATYLLARRSPVAAVALMGGRRAADLILVNDYQELGCDLRLATDDGSEGHAGVVTDLLPAVLDRALSRPLAVYACGPNPMLRQVAEIVQTRGLDAEISLDHVMCCGVGACFACVVKMRADTTTGWEYVQTCLDGPVFQASRVVWD